MTYRATDAVMNGGTAAGVNRSDIPCDAVTVSGWCDADWGGDLSDRKSTTGYVLRVCGGVVTWQSKKQSTVALSTAEAEYMAISRLLQEVVWMHQLLEEIGVRHRVGVGVESMEVLEQLEDGTPQIIARDPVSRFNADSSLPSLTVLHSDNQSAIAMCSSDAEPRHQRTKHIDMRHHFIRDAVKSGVVSLKWVASCDQVADLFTKSLDRHTFESLREKLLGIADRSEQQAMPSSSLSAAAAARGGAGAVAAAVESAAPTASA
jgi:hypothetical protein